MKPPNRIETADTIRQLLSGKRTRKSASEWACEWLLNCRAIDDAVVWEAITLLGAADLISTDRPYLYSEEDFAEMLKKLS